MTQSDLEFAHENHLKVSSQMGLHWVIKDPDFGWAIKEILTGVIEKVYPEVLQSLKIA